MDGIAHRERNVVSATISAAVRETFALGMDVSSSGHGIAEVNTAVLASNVRVVEAAFLKVRRIVEKAVLAPAELCAGLPRQMSAGFEKESFGVSPRTKRPTWNDK